MDAKNLEELSTVEYWDRRYMKQTEGAGVDGGSVASVALSAHEWFRSFEQLRPFFTQRLEIIPKESTILHLGCGDSTLPADLYDLGFHKQICIDFSHIVIEQMRQRYQGIDVQWTTMDVRDIKLPDNSIDLAVDKGTLDAFLHGSLWDPPDDVRENVGKYVDNVGRVLRPHARWIYITYRQPHFMKPLLSRPIWDLEVQSLNDDTGGFEYFAFIMCKRATSDPGGAIKP